MAQLEHIDEIEKGLWAAADTLRNSKLASNETFLPVMGLIFLRHAYSRYLKAKEAIVKTLPSRGGVTRPLTKEDFSAQGALYLRDFAQFDYLKGLPDNADRADAIRQAMASIEEDYEDLRGVLPKNDYAKIDNRDLGELLVKLDPEALKHVDGDVFGRIYEYFLVQFAGAKAHDNGEFFTPVSLVSFIANVLNPEQGILLDPACGSGGMFVQSAHVVERQHHDPSKRLTFYGMEKNETTIRLAKMNLAVHGLEGKVAQAISYYEDPHELVGRCDYVMANPPFNVDDIDAERAKSDPRMVFGLPGVNKQGKLSNGNYAWISYFYSYLSETGKAGFVMAAGAEAAGGAEALVRQKLIESGHVAMMVSIRSNFFYTRSVPCMLWFFDKALPEAQQGKVLMLDARNVFRQVTRKICDFSPEQTKNLLAIRKLYLGDTEAYRQTLADHRAQAEAVDLSAVAEFWKTVGKDASDTVADIEAATKERLAEIDAEARAMTDKKEQRRHLKTKKEVEALSSEATEALKLKQYYFDAADWLEKRFPDGVYADVPGLVRAVTVEEIAENDWSLTPGRYVGVEEEEADDEDFAESMQAIQAELSRLNAESVVLARTIEENLKGLLA